MGLPGNTRIYSAAGFFFNALKGMECMGSDGSFIFTILKMESPFRKSASLEENEIWSKLLMHL